MSATVPEFDHFDMTLTAMPSPSPPSVGRRQPEQDAQHRGREGVNHHQHQLVDVEALASG